MIKDHFAFSLISLRKRGLRSILTIMGIFIGIAAVISLISLGEGLRAAVLGQFSFLSTDILTVRASGLHFGPPGEAVVSPLQEAYVSDLEHLRGVDMAIGRIIEDAKLQFNGHADFTFATSMPNGEKREEVQRIAQFEIDKGRMLKDTDTRKVVLGSNYGLPERLGKAATPRDRVTIQGQEFQVVGILKKKGSFIVDNIILMNEDVVKELFSANETYDVIAIKVAEGAQMGAVKLRVEEFLRKEREVKRGEEDFTVESPEQSIKNLDATLFAIQIFVYVIAGISIIVGGIGIANTMYTSVVERTRQIGIMKAIGATRTTIFSLFLIEAGLLGASGGIMGILIGIALAYGISFTGSALLNTDLIRVGMSWFLIIGAFVFSLGIGTIAGMLPALQAAKLNPVDALRHAK